jgi:prepilin-type processing-associated H-X9-DG protein
VFVFMDERPDVINWGDYLTDMTGYSTQPSMYQFGGDMPGMYHNLGATISFADGRAEIKRWADPRTTPPPGSVSSSTYPSPGNVDIAWIQDHATRPK